MQRGSNTPAKKKPGRVSLPPSSPLTTPTSGNFFAGIGPGPGAPARNTQIPNLTQHVAVAKAKVQALKDAGLVPEAKREAAVQAQALIDRSKPAAKRTPQTTPKAPASKSPGLPAPSTLPPAFRTSTPSIPQPQQPVFTREDPSLYGKAFARNKAIAKPGPYLTQLPASQEAEFRSWVKQNKVPFDPEAKVSDYDMRGYWLASKDAKHAPGQHFPDTFKTPYDTTFSRESKYATPDNPLAWQGDTIINQKTGRVVFGEPTQRLPAWLSKPAVSLTTPPEKRALAPTLPPPRRGALSPRVAAIQAGPPAHSGSGFGFLTQPLIGQKAAGAALGALKPVGHALDLAAGTTAAAGNISAIDAAKDPGKWIGDIKRRGLVGTEEAATEIAGRGLNLPNVIPSADLVPTAGAASTTEQSPEKLVAAGLTEAQTKKFRERAVKKMGWYKGEIDGLVGLDLIKHAYSKPPPMPIRILNNFGAGVIRTAGLVNVAPALAQEVATGHAGRAGKQLGEALVKQGSAIVSNPAEAFVSDPYGTIPIVGGGLKTLGSAGRLIGKGAEPIARDVALASTGAVVNRGVRDKNAYIATGQVLADKAASQFPAVARKLEAGQVDKLVSDVSNATAPLHHGVQTDYAKAFKDVGEKRATILASINKAGGKPEKILAKYVRDGNERQVKHWTQVVEAQKNLTEKDATFLAAHKALGEQTTGTHVELGRFSDTAGVYRSHQPLILSDAHAGDPMAQRVQALHDEWTKALRTTDDQETLAPLFGAYDHAVREYADTHLAQGGFEPTRVAYTPPPDTGAFTSPYRKGTGGKVRFNARVPKQQASTGGSFESGDYLVDPKVALRENLQAQRLRTSVGLTSDESLGKIGAVKATRGDERPAGYVFTPSQNPATVGKVISDLHDQPVGAHDYYHQESSIRDRLAKSLEHDADKTGEHAKTDGWFVPEGAWNRILDYTRPESRGAYDKFMRQYQRALISIYPSTMLGNTVGSTPMAMVAGAGGKSFRQAARSSSFKGDPTIVPFSTHGRGVAGNLAADTRNPISSQMNRNRRINVIGEDYSRDAVYFSHVLPGSTKRAKELGYADRDVYFRDLASGKVDKHLRDAALSKVIKFVGDAAKPSSKATHYAGKVILFPQWVQHMSKLMLVTLPVHHPRRMALINGLAEYGDQYRKEHGALPSWMQDFFPLYTHSMGGDDFTRVVGGSQLAPQGTAGGPFDTLTRSGSFVDRAVGLANPPVAALAKTLLQGRDNLSSDYPVDMTRFAMNQAFYTLPGASKFFPRTGQESTSLPWDPQTYTVPFRDAGGGKHALPWDRRMGARPVGGLLGIASRVLGAPLYDVPTPDSKTNKREVSTKLYKAKHPPKKH